MLKKFKNTIQENVLWAIEDYVDTYSVKLIVNDSYFQLPFQFVGKPRLSARSRN